MESKKTGILTLPLNTNYGGILQNFALQQVLKKQGHNPVTINYDYIVKLPLATGPLIYLKNIILRYILKKKVVLFPDIALNKLRKVQRQKTDLFIKGYIDCIYIKSTKQLNSKEYKCLIVGSDQIWRHAYNGCFPGVSNSFLDFAKEWNVKRIAYAASFGTDEWEYNEEETKICSELAQKFDAISVREASAVNICKKRLGVDAMHVLDPTMLLAAEDYKKLFIDAGTPQSPGNLMCYILDPSNETNNIIKLVAKSHELIPFHTNSRVEDDTAPIKERVQPPVENWLRGFHDAQYVITDSFHACVFSILFNKPFIVYGNKERGMARFNSLLSIFNLQDRLVATPQEAETVINKAINWEEVNNILEEWREKSNNFLKAHL